MKQWLGALCVGVFGLVACGGDDGGGAGPAAIGGSGGDAAGAGGEGKGGKPSGTGGANETGGSGPATGGQGAGGEGPSTGGLGAGGMGATGGGNSGGEGGTPSTVPSITGPASHTADGVLTNLPSLTFVNAGGDLEIATAYFTLDVLSSFNSVRIWGDLKNTGTSWQCIILGDLSMGGFDILTIADGPPYLGSLSTSEQCIPPGGTGVFQSISNDVTANLLTTATTVTYAFDGFVPSTPPTQHPGTPTLAAESIGPVSLGWAVSGTIKAGSIDIYNLGMDFYIRDSSGLLRDDTSAYPNDLGTILAASQVPFESYSTADEFDDYVLIMSFIEGAAGGFSAQSFTAPTAEEARLAEWRSAKSALRAAKSAR